MTIDGALPRYTLHTPLTPLCEEAGVYGMYNPSLAAASRKPEMLVTWGEAWSDIGAERSLGFFGLVPPGLGLGYSRYQHGDTAVGETGIAAGFGNRSAGIGLGYGVQSLTVDSTFRTHGISTGFFLRPIPVISVGASVRSAHNNKPAFAAGVAAKAFGDRVTMFGSYGWNGRPKADSLIWAWGAALKIMPGVSLSGRTSGNETWSAGISIGLGRHRLGSHYRARPRRDGMTFFQLRVGAPRATSLALSWPKRYLKLRLDRIITRRQFMFDQSGMTLAEVLAAIENARHDPRIEGIAINAEGISTSRAILWEVGDKLHAFRKSGKRVVIYIDGGDLDIYRFAAAADQIVLDPRGFLLLDGYAAGRTYFRGTLEKLGVGFDEWRYYKYKTAYENYARDNMSAADSIQFTAILNSLYKNVRADICRDRDIAPHRFDSLVNDSALFWASSALASGLIDTIGRWETLKAIAGGGDAGNVSFISADNLYPRPARADRAWSEPPRIALVYALGICDMDRGIRARTLAKTLRKLARKRSVKAIVVRVDSPGGLALPSDLVGEALAECRKKKPVIVSQGATAASGGYWISMFADTIFAAPNTMTGSIGVISGWVYNRGLKEKLGIATDLVKVGKHADIYFGASLPYLPFRLPDRALDSTEKQRVELFIRGMYDDFVEKAAGARDTSEAWIDSIARGRVWTGAQARALGLIDNIGRLDNAISAACAMGGIERGTWFEIDEYPASRLNITGMLLGTVFSGNSLRGEYLRLRLENNGRPLVVLPEEFLRFGCPR